MRKFRRGEPSLFTAPREPRTARRVAPAKDRARGRVIELRREDPSIYEISGKLAAEGSPLNRVGVAEILAEDPMTVAEGQCSGGG